MQESHPYTLTLSLSVLKELGINLYSNVSAVIAETIANAWDADAENVSIKLDKDSGTIIITDDGHGMGMTSIGLTWMPCGHKLLP